MGNKEALLAAAKRCLADKGLVLTTARDIAADAGVSLAAIGYHYRSKDALLAQALLEALQQWGDDLGRALAAVPAAGADGERFTAAWTAVAASFSANPGLWRLQFEMLAHLHRFPELRDQLAEATREARAGLAALIGPEDAEVDPLVLGGFYQVVLGGIAAQWLVDPDTALTGPNLRAAVSALAPRFEPALEIGDSGARDAQQVLTRP